MTNPLVKHAKPIQRVESTVLSTGRQGRPKLAQLNHPGAALMRALRMSDEALKEAGEVLYNSYADSSQYPTIKMASSLLSIENRKHAHYNHACGIAQSLLPAVIGSLISLGYTSENNSVETELGTVWTGLAVSSGVTTSADKWLFVSQPSSFGRIFTDSKGRKCEMSVWYEGGLDLDNVAYYQNLTSLYQISVHIPGLEEHDLGFTPKYDKSGKMTNLPAVTFGELLGKLNELLYSWYVAEAAEKEAEAIALKEAERIAKEEEELAKLIAEEEAKKLEAAAVEEPQAPAVAKPRVTKKTAA